MEKLPILSGNDVIRVLSKAGFLSVRQRGSHVIMVKLIDGKKAAVVVPIHKEIDRGTLIEIIRQAKITRETFISLC